MKKGDATMVATVLLIISAIVIGVLVSTFSRETEKRVEDKIIKMGNVIECEDVGIGLIIKEDNIKVKNTGTLGIDKIKARRYLEGGDIVTNDIGFTDRLLPNQESNSVNSLETYKIEFIPIIKANNNEEIGCERKIVTWEP